MGAVALRQGLAESRRLSSAELPRLASAESPCRTWMSSRSLRLLTTQLLTSYCLLLTTYYLLLTTYYLLLTTYYYHYAWTSSKSFRLRELRMKRFGSTPCDMRTNSTHASMRVPSRLRRWRTR